ncbi:MAG: hypothetical protein CEE38_23720 [Planctomycetes bacterium B3_Pla]|nr:MAG: hypothetical protein CEE38_23720 [Planctomycetes bacterium B3_Pla]
MKQAEFEKRKITRKAGEGESYAEDGEEKDSDRESVSSNTRGALERKATHELVSDLKLSTSASSSEEEEGLPIKQSTPKKNERKRVHSPTKSEKTKREKFTVYKSQELVEDEDEDEDDDMEDFVEEPRKDPKTTAAKKTVKEKSGKKPSSEAGTSKTSPTLTKSQINKIIQEAKLRDEGEDSDEEMLEAEEEEEEPVKKKTHKVKSKITSEPPRERTTEKTPSKERTSDIRASRPSTPDRDRERRADRSRERRSESEYRRTSSAKSPQPRTSRYDEYEKSYKRPGKTPYQRDDRREDESPRQQTHRPVRDDYDPTLWHDHIYADPRDKIPKTKYKGGKTPQEIEKELYAAYEAHIQVYGTGRREPRKEVTPVDPEPSISATTQKTPTRTTPTQTADMIGAESAATITYEIYSPKAKYETKALSPKRKAATPREAVKEKEKVEVHKKPAPPPIPVPQRIGSARDRSLSSEASGATTDADRLRQRAQQSVNRGAVLHDPRETASIPETRGRRIEVTARPATVPRPPLFTREYDRLGRPSEYTGEYAKLTNRRIDLGAGPRDCVMPEIALPDSRFRCVRFGPLNYGPSDFRDDGVYVQVPEIRVGIHNVYHSFRVIRVRGMDISDPFLQSGFTVLPQWALRPRSDAINRDSDSLRSSDMNQIINQMNEPGPSTRDDSFRLGLPTRRASEMTDQSETTTKLEDPAMTKE